MKKNYYSKILSFALASSLMSVPVVFAQETTNEGTLETITIDTNLEEDVIPSHVDLFDLENKTGFIYFNDLNKKEVSMDGVIELFEENKNLFKIENPTLELREVESFTDNLGFTHIKVQQQFNDIPLHGHEYIIHFNNDSEIYAVNGNLDLSVYNKADRGISRDTKLDSDLALAVAKKHIMADSYADNYTVERFLYEENGEYKNTFEVKIPTVEPIGDWTVIIDATNGDVIEASDRLNLAQTEGSGVGVLNDHKTFNTELYNNLYYLYDNSRNGTIIKTYDANNTNYQWSLPGNYVTDKDNVFDSKRQKAAVDAHKYASYVYDFYKDKFGRDSIDGNGMDLVSSVHFKRNYVNAFWWNNQMTYGDGDGTTAIALSGALDIVAHEMTHGVTQYTANLKYENQSGALNESMSDVFGTLVEMEYQPEKADYLCGEDVWTPNTPGDALRDLANPENYNQPAHMRDFVNTSEDHGGVHTNSGIPNKAGYLVIDSVGKDKAAQIYYRALTTYLTSTSDFHDAKLALMQSAKDLYGTGSEYNAVEDAFNAVGIN